MENLYYTQFSHIDFKDPFFDSLKMIIRTLQDGLKRKK